MAQADTPANDPGDEEVRYDLAGNPLPPKPKAVPAPPSAPPPGGFLAAPAFAPPHAFAPPPGFTPPPGAVSLARPAPAAQSAPTGPALYGGLALTALVLVGLIFVVRALRPVAVAAPAAYRAYTAIDNSFSCDRPVGWTMHETGATSGVESTVSFDKAQARVRVISDSVGSLMADTMTSSNTSVEPLPGMPPPPPPTPAVEKLHAMDKAQLAADLPGYKEGEMQKLESRVGDARVSEWTSDDKKHGYRVTMLGNQREMTVICIAPERDWAALKPAFQRMITSVVPGNG